jgi:23S rRNA pseudouridine1911/1915/1917 synthase
MKNIEMIVKEKSKLLEYLLKEITYKSKNNIKTLLKEGKIHINNKKVTQFDYDIKSGDRLLIKQALINDDSMLNDIEIVYEDSDLIAINKPHGLLSIATLKEKEKTAYNFVSNYVKQRGSFHKIFVVHRLDRDTSGVLLFAKNEKTKGVLQDNWNDIVRLRGYIALVEGVTLESGTIRNYLKESETQRVYATNKKEEGKEAITHYKKIKNNKEYSLLEVFIDTGRKNQIRVHMSDLGHPVIGDKKYGSTKSPLNRLGLHAHVLEFEHPITKKVMRFEAKIPKKFTAVVK